jgi:D-erythronate 2-dehydrogenase
VQAGTAWLLSVPACTTALRHAGDLDAAAIGRDRTLTLPALRVTLSELVAALARRHPHGATRIDHAPDPVLQAQFASQPPLSTPAADRLGFRHDGDVDRLVERAVAPVTRSQPPGD